MRGDARLAANGSQFVEQALSPLQVFFATAGVMQRDGFFQQVDASQYLAGLAGIFFAQPFKGGAPGGEV